jgi:hypothetical protein
MENSFGYDSEALPLPKAPVRRGAKGHDLGRIGHDIHSNAPIAAEVERKKRAFACN